MRSYGGASPSGKDDLFTVSEAIRVFAEDVGLACTTRPQLPVGFLTLAEGATAGGCLAHHPQAAGQHPDHPRVGRDHSAYPTITPTSPGNHVVVSWNVS